MPTRVSLPPDLVVERLTAKTAPPPMFKVILLNDDYTPMEFVVHILEKFFGKKPNMTVNPDEVVAIGAAIAAAGLL